MQQHVVCMHEFILYLNERKSVKRPGLSGTCDYQDCDNRCTYGTILSHLHDYEYPYDNITLYIFDLTQHTSTKCINNREKGK